MTRALVLATAVLFGCVSAVRAAAPAEVLSVKKVWDQAPHSAFTDLCRFDGRWWMVFRESQAHVGGNGVIRVLSSADGDAWTSAAVVAEEGIDLRDPKVSVTPQGKLMLLMGGSVYEGKTLKGRQPRVAFSADGHEWSTPVKVMEEGDWLWRLTWHDGVAWGTSYRDNTLALVRSEDGVKWTKVTDLDVTGRPNETALHFLPDGRMVALVRREEGDKNGWIGVSAAPFTQWKWSSTGHRIGGPEFVVLPDATMWAGGREGWGKDAKMVIARMGLDHYQPVLTLPSGGDCSYPGMVWHDGVLWVSYYSSHEGKTSIYLAKLRVGK